MACPPVCSPHKRRYLVSILAVSGLGVWVLAAAMEASRLGEESAPSPTLHDDIGKAFDAFEAELQSDARELAVVVDNLPLESLWLCLSRDRSRLLGLQVLDARRQPLAHFGALAADLPGRFEVTRGVLHGARRAFLRLCCQDALQEARPRVSTGLLLSRHLGACLLACSVLLLLFDRRQLSQKLTRGYLENVDKMAMGLANCIRNSLNSMRFSLATARRRRAQAGPSLTSVSGEISHLERLVDRFLSFSQPRSWVVEPHFLDKVVREAVLHAQAEFAERGVCFETELEAQLSVDICPEALDKAVHELLANAAEACPRGGSVRVRLERLKNQAAITVDDDGPGVAVELRPQLFQPFTSADPDRPGLGLAIAHSLVEVHGGTLELLEGSRFRISFPLVPPS